MLKEYYAYITLHVCYMVLQLTMYSYSLYKNKNVFLKPLVVCRNHPPPLSPTQSRPAPSSSKKITFHPTLEMKKLFPCAKCVDNADKHFLSENESKNRGCEELKMICAEQLSSVCKMVDVRGVLFEKQLCRVV